MENAKTMTFKLPIKREELKEANRKIARLARDKRRVEIIWRGKYP